MPAPRSARRESPLPSVRAIMLTQELHVVPDKCYATIEEVPDETDIFSLFDLEPDTTSFLIPTFVNSNHWMPCIARFPDADSREGTLLI